MEVVSPEGSQKFNLNRYLEQNGNQIVTWCHLDSSPVTVSLYLLQTAGKDGDVAK